MRLHDANAHTLHTSAGSCCPAVHPPLLPPRSAARAFILWLVAASKSFSRTPQTGTALYLLAKYRCATSNEVPLNARAEVRPSDSADWCARPTPPTLLPDSPPRLSSSRNPESAQLHHAPPHSSVQPSPCKLNMLRLRLRLQLQAANCSQHHPNPSAPPLASIRRICASAVRSSRRAAVAAPVRCYRSTSRWDWCARC